MFQIFLLSFFFSLPTVKNKLKGKTKARFIFFLASHGHLDEDQRGWINLFGSNLNKLNSTCIKMSILKDFAESIDCRHQLYLLDCCHAGSLLVSPRGGHHDSSLNSSSQYARAMLESPAIHGLTAVTKNQQALEEGGHGMFTRSFAEGLDGGVGVFARAERNHVTTTELFSYVQRRVLELAKNKGRDQTPRFEQLIVNHKQCPCNGQMLFFDWDLTAPPPSKQSSWNSVDAETKEAPDKHKSNTSITKMEGNLHHLSAFKDFNRTTTDKILKRKSFGNLHMRSHRRSRTLC